MVGVYRIHRDTCCVFLGIFKCSKEKRRLAVEKKERRWLYFLVFIFVVANVFTLSTLIPWQEWLLWNDVQPDQIVNVEFGNYDITSFVGICNSFKTAGVLITPVITEVNRRIKKKARS